MEIHETINYCKTSQQSSKHNKIGNCVIYGWLWRLYLFSEAMQVIEAIKSRLLMC